MMIVFIRVTVAVTMAMAVSTVTVVMTVTVWTAAVRVCMPEGKNTHEVYQEPYNRHNLKTQAKELEKSFSKIL